HRPLPSLPTRRSSDLVRDENELIVREQAAGSAREGERDPLLLAHAERRADVCERVEAGELDVGRVAREASLLRADQDRARGGCRSGEHTPETQPLTKP